MCGHKNNISYNHFIGILRQPIGGNVVTNQIMEELKTMFDYTITPQYLVADKEAVDASQPPKFRSRDRPNTTDSFHKYQQDVSYDFGMTEL